MPDVKTMEPSPWEASTYAQTRIGDGAPSEPGLMLLGNAAAQPVTAFEPTIVFTSYSASSVNLAAADNRAFLRLTDADPTLTIPLQASVPLADGFLCWGTFTAGGTIAIASGGTINGTNGANVTVGAEADGAGFTLRRTSADTWVLTLGSSAEAMGGLLEGDDGFVAVQDGEFVTVPYLESAGAANRFWTNDSAGDFKEATAAEAAALLDFSAATMQVTGLNIGHASDTTVTRHAAGVVAVEGLPLFPNLPITDVNAAKTFTLTEMNQGWMHPSADTTARVWTIPSNASVAAPRGSFLTFINEGSAGVVTIAINTDTLIWSPTGGTGSRALAPYGMATAFKKTATSWIISGWVLT